MSREVKNTRKRDTSANRARKDKDPRFQRFGKSNGSFKDGNSPHAYRLRAGAKPNQIVHHKNENKGDGRKSNLEVLPGKGASAIAAHNKEHGATKGRLAAIARLRNEGKPVPSKLLQAARNSYHKGATPGPLRRK